MSDVRLADYRRDGHILVDGIVGAADLAALRAEADRLAELTVNASVALGEMSPRLDVCRRRDGSLSLRKIQPLSDISELIARLVVDERLLAPLRALLGDEPVAFEEKLNYKQALPGDLAIPAAREGDAFDLHHDWAYFDQNGYPRESLSVALAIDAATAENGCMRVLPGSHTRDWPLRSDGPPLLVAGAVRDDALVDLPQPAGSALVFHSGLVHGSGDNASHAPRRLLILSYHPAWHVTEPDRRNRPLRVAGQAHEARYQALREQGYEPVLRLVQSAG